MKIFIGPYSNYFSPYHIAEKIMFWKKRHRSDAEDEAIFNFGEWLAMTKDGKHSWLYNLCEKLNSYKKRKIKIRIDDYDAYSADHTLALIILPVLKEIRNQKMSTGFVDDADFPEELRTISVAALTEDEKCLGKLDDNWFKLWEWVLDEMIWTFEQHAMDNWEEQYYSGESDLQFDSTGYITTGPNDTFKIDQEGIKEHSARMLRGRILFAKYYESLWT